MTAAALQDALRAWADHIYMLARMAAKARAPMHSEIVCGTDMADWRSHMSQRERAVIDECMRLGIWGPDDGQ